MGIEVDGANQKLILDSDGDTYIEGATDDTLKVYVSGAEDLRIGANAINVLSGTTLTIDSGATITNSGTANGFGALAGIDDQTSSNDDQLTITDTAVVINEDSDDLDFRVESNGNANMLFVSGGNDVVGVGAEGDLGAGLHIKTADSSASVSSDADELVIEGSGNSGMSILSGTSNSGNIFFGDSGDNDVGFITYEHNNERMIFGAGANHTLQVGGAEVVVNNDSDDVDFRVESNGNTHMIFTNGDTNTMGLGVTSASDVFLTVKDGTGISGNWWINADNVHAGDPSGLIINTSGSNNDSTAQKFYAAQDSSAMRFMVFVDGDVVNHDNSYGAISDQRIKQNIVDANSQWNDIKALKVRNFKKKDDVRQYGEDKAWTEIGLVAQEAELVSPKLIKENPPSVNDVLSDSAFGTLVDDTSSPKYYQDGDTIPSGKKIGDEKLDGSGNVIYNKKVGEEKQKVKSIKYSVLYMKAIKALQEAQTRIETLETKVKALEG